MDLQQEAAAFINVKQTHFFTQLAAITSSAESFILGNLHHSDEREAALMKLREMQMWCRAGVETIGIK